MGDIEEDRIYADTLGKTDVYVAADLGVAEVSVSNDRIGHFSLAHRCSARDIAADGTGLLVATDEDVLAIEPGDEPTVESLGFGPAVAVGVADAPLAAGPDGTVARSDDDGWTELGTVADPRAIDGPLIAAEEGVFRVTDGLEHVGLDDAYDVVGGSTPYAATGNGLYRLGPGWTRELDGSFRVVTAEGSRAHAATASELYVQGDREWHERVLSTDEALVDIGYVAKERTDGESKASVDSHSDGGTVAVTGSGTVLVDPAAAKDGVSGWRSRSLGLTETTAMAVPDQ
ncbi:MAG: hypothetical protein V5A27_05835 [Halapricum sp.]